MDGHINESILRMRSKLIERKKKKEQYGKISAIGMCIGLIPLLRLFFLQDLTLGTLLGMLSNPIIWAGIMILALSCGAYKVYYEKEKGKYDALREELMGKISNGFCSCWSACNCQEEFLRETNDKYKINLYWK